MKTNPNKRHIFLVDDDQEDRELFSEALSYVNQKVDLTELPSGFKLIEALKNPEYPKPEIIFLDLNMPKLNGLECLKKLKSPTSEFKDLKVVILSTYSNADEIEEAYNYGAGYYYVKPTAFDNLKNVIMHALGINWNKRNSRNKENFLVNNLA
jgi:CheY-like chemotaxis protein